MTKVLVIATSRKTRGGITSVIKAYENSMTWKQFHCHWVQTHRDGPSWRKLAYLAVAILDYIIRLPFYDIVHVHFSLETTAKRKLPFVKLAKLFNKKVIAHLHCGSQIDKIWNGNYQYLFSNADVSLFLSESLKSKVESKIGKHNHFEVCYNPCPKVGIDEHIDKKKIILFSGTLNKGKGYHDLILAFSKISDKCPDWKVVFAGNGEIEEGIKLAEKFGVTSQVEFLGWISGKDKERAFNEASIFCLPSYAEGFPMAVLDAWAYGLPVITTPVGGIPDVAKDGQNILLFSPGDIESLSSRLELLISNEKLRSEISEASRSFAANEFNQKTINQKLETIYNQLITSND